MSQYPNPFEVYGNSYSNNPFGPPQPNNPFGASAQPNNPFGANHDPFGQQSYMEAQRQAQMRAQMEAQRQAQMRAQMGARQPQPMDPRYQHTYSMPQMNPQAN